MERRFVILPLLVVFLVACSQGGFQEPIASTITKPQTTYAPSIPTRTRVGNYDVFDGVSSFSELVLDIDGPQATANLKGKMEIRPIDGKGASVQVPLHVRGTIDPETRAALLWPTNPVELEALKIKVGVKLMCLQEDCSESFLDIYVKYKGRIYHHQVKAEIKQDLFDAESGQTIQPSPKKRPTLSFAPETAKSPEKSSSPDASKDAPKGSEPADSQEESKEVMSPEEMEAEHDLDHDEQLGAFVGEPEKDLEVFFPEEPKNHSMTPESATPESAAPPQKEDADKEDTDKSKTPPKSTSSSTDGNKKESTVPSLGQKLMNTISQAIGANTRGRLQNAVNIYSHQRDSAASGFNILYPKREAHYGTTDMLQTILRIGQFSLKKVNGYVVSVGDISRKNGGRLGRHSSHQRGLDVDIAYYFDNRSMQKGFINVLSSSTHKRAWMAEKQWELFKSLVATQIVDRIFVDTRLKRELCEVAARSGELKSGTTAGVPFETLRVLRHAGGHGNHFHLRLKCSKGQARCQQMAPPPKASGC